MTLFDPLGLVHRAAGRRRPLLGRIPIRPFHRSNGSWGSLCGVTDNGSTLITDRDAEVTCKRCLARMRALLRRHGPGIAR